MRSTLVFFATLALALTAPNPFSRRNAPSGRIIGGLDTNITEYPHQISLEYYGFHICGGTIISEEWIVTGAQCTSGFATPHLQVRAGTTTIESGGVLSSLSEVHVHPNFNPLLVDFDISLGKLATPFILSDSVKPISLPSAPPSDGLEVATTGWGTTTELGTSFNTVLQVVFVNIVPIAECRVAYSSETVTNAMLCAAVPEGGKGFCRGDYGGPLVASNTLYGIASWAYGCGRPGVPGVYCNVASVRAYINEITGL